MKNYNPQIVMFFIVVISFFRSPVSAQEEQKITLLYPGENRYVSAPAMLIWHALPNVQAYHVQIFNNENNNVVEDVPSVVGTSYTTNKVTYNKNFYRWKVAPAGTSNWSESRTMITYDLCVPISPVNNASISLPITFTWNAKQGASSYNFSIYEINQNTGIPGKTIFTRNVSTNAITVNDASLKNGVKYIWDVKPFPETGNNWTNSADAIFTVGSSVPLPPMPVSPAYDAKNVSIPVSLSWQASPGAQSYGVQIASDQNFGQPVVDEIAYGTSYTSNKLLINTTYYWRVNAKNAVGSGTFSATWLFTTGSTVNPMPPTLVSPANGAANQPTTVTMTWAPAPNAQSYNLQIARTASFSNNSLVGNISNIVGATFTVPNLVNGTTYYWRLSSITPSGLSAYSEPFSFTVQSLVPTPGAVTLLMPANHSRVNVTQQVLFVWNAAANATTYTLQVALTPDFTAPFINNASVAMPYQIVSLPMFPVNTVYYWRVSGSNTAGQGPWSPVFLFSAASVGIDNDPSTPHMPLTFNMSRANARGNGAIIFRANARSLTNVSLHIFDVKGAMIFNGTYELTKNNKEIAWNMTNTLGSKVAAGVYYALMETVPHSRDGIRSSAFFTIHAY